MRPDLAKTGVIEIADDFIALRYRADRVVQNQCRPDIVSRENRQHLPQRLDRAYPGGAPRARSDPVEFGFGVHHDRQHRLLRRRPRTDLANAKQAACEWAMEWIVCLG